MGTLPYDPEDFIGLFLLNFKPIIVEERKTWWQRIFGKGLSIPDMNALEEHENFIHNKYGYCYYALPENESPIIFNLYVEPEYRRQGHARKLLHYVINEIRNTHLCKIETEVQPRENSINSEALISFYKSMGLRIKDGTN